MASVVLCRLVQFSVSVEDLMPTSLPHQMLYLHNVVLLVAWAGVRWSVNVQFARCAYLQFAFCYFNSCSDTQSKRSFGLPHSASGLWNWDPGKCVRGGHREEPCVSSFEHSFAMAISSVIARTDEYVLRSKVSLWSGWMTDMTGIFFLYCRVQL